MTIKVAVIDAAAIVDILCRYPPGVAAAAALRRAHQVATPAHMDAEVLQALARIRRSQDLEEIEPQVTQLAELSVARIPLAPLLLPALDLLANIAAKDALYVALAQTMGAHLVTTDERLKRAAGTIVPLA